MENQTELPLNSTEIVLHVVQHDGNKSSHKNVDKELVLRFRGSNNNTTTIVEDKSDGESSILTDVINTPPQVENDNNDSLNPSKSVPKEKKSTKKVNKKSKKTLSCEYCRFTTIHSSSLSKHLKIHEGFKPYSCSYCALTFYRKDSLKVHEKIHTREDIEKHVCGQCEKKFPTRNNLREHIKRIHECYILYCPYSPCSVKYSTRTLLNRHIKARHCPEIQRFYCSKCDVRFPYKHQIERHYTTKKHNRNQNSEEMQQEITVIPKNKEEENNIFAGPNCVYEVKEEKLSNSFTMMSDIQISNIKGEKIHECPLCQKSFRTIKKLGKHLDRKHIAM